MKFALLPLVIALITTVNYAQSGLKRFPFIDENKQRYNAEIVSFSPGEIFVVWSDYESSGYVVFYMHKSSDDGATWSPMGVVFDTLIAGMTEDPYKGATLIKGNNNRLILLIKMGFDRNTIYKFSDDGGVTWSANRNINLQGPAIQYPDPSRASSVVHLGNGNIRVITHSRITLSHRETVSTDNGNTWSSPSIISGYILENPSLLANGTSGYYMVGEQYHTTQPKEIWFAKKSSSGSLQFQKLIFSHPLDNLLLPKISRESDSSLTVVFLRKQKIFNTFDISTTWSSKSIDEGATWSEPVQLTNYKGLETNLNLNGQSVKPIFTVSGDRGANAGNKFLSWGNATTIMDTAAPPIIYAYTFSKDTLHPGDTIAVKLYTGEGSTIISTGFSGTINGSATSFPLYDDGLHNDSLAGDKIFGNSIIIGDHNNALVGKFFTASRYDTAQTERVMIMATIPSLSQIEVLKTGRLIIPFNSSGEIGGVSSSFGSKVRFDSIPVIASQGFLLSGYLNSQVWAAGKASSFLFRDFQAGSVDSPANDPRKGIYRIARTDSAFGASWKWWKFAVDMGARYWDGDNNGYYDPIDLNNNGIWEPNEDMPEILGEVSYFTVYNDGVSSSQRKFSENPLGIEVRQTLYAWPSSTSDEMRNAVFVRYEIVNRTTSMQPLTNFIFSTQHNVDIGDSINDLIHTDTLRNSIVTYNKGADGLFGANPPAVYNTLLFGEPVTIPGVSFFDVNQNNIWDPGIDLALDTAVIPLGYPFEPRIFPGAVNSQMAAAVQYINQYPTQSIPANSTEARNYMTGRNRIGELLQPCYWVFGSVAGPVNCELINPIFAYSGDPVSGAGWINNIEMDAMTGMASGQKTLAPGAIFTFHTVMVVQRGNSPLNSLSLTRAAVDTIFNRLGASYTYVPVSIKSEGTETPATWELWQNFPNPFNPSTTIRFALPVGGSTSIKIYDITGALLKVLVSEELPAGKHEVSFDGSNFASGIYFYRLETPGYTMTRKMLLMK